MKTESKYGPTGYYVYTISDIETNKKYKNGASYPMENIHILPWATNNCQMSVISNAHVLASPFIDKEELDKIIGYIEGYSQGQILIDVDNTIKKKVLKKLKERYPDYEILMKKTYNNPTGSEMSIIIFKWDKYDYEDRDEDDLYDDEEDDGDF